MDLEQFNVYKNLTTKVKHLLNSEKTLNKEERRCFQWQLYTSIPTFDKFTFVMGKGGANTMFFYPYQGHREVCLPDDMVKILEKMSNSNFFCVGLYSDKKELLKTFLCEEYALEADPKGAKYISGIRHDGKRRLLYTRERGLTGKPAWVKS